ncbi:O-linked N-acetylglucosamine transferase family protein [Chitinimonas lacunae]|uniref:protein O-GlcNAc transferase n=1 Tax=Chitinimonas lacunae TaxID=1963018 RepID=A0ABV8MU32_9NEIS
MTPQQALRLGLGHHQSGRLAEAEAVYRQLLEQVPGYADAWHLLGVTRLQQGDAAGAVTLIERALHHQPDTADYYANLAEAHRQAGSAQAAVGAAEHALRLTPRHAAARNALGLARLDEGDAQAAAQALRTLLADEPRHLHGRVNLLTVLRRLGHDEEAITVCQEGLQLYPANPTLAQQLGDLLLDQHRPAAALAAYQEGAKAGWNAALLKGAALAQAQLGRPDQAEPYYRTLFQHWPDDADGWNNWAALLIERGEDQAADEALARVLRLSPNHPGALANAAMRAIAEQRHIEAEALLTRLLTCAPAHAEAWNHLGRLRIGQGRVEEALDAWSRAMAVDPRHDQAHSNLLFGRHYLAGPDAAELGHAHRQWAQRHGESAQRPVPAPRSDGRLRIGYLSPDLRRHPVGFLLAGVLPGHDRSRFRLHAYADLARPDPLSLALHGQFEGWTTITGWSDAQVAEQLRADGVDILIDLAGHTAGQRLGVLALRPAPMQVSWLGYVNTTGLRSVDYLLTDRRSSPPDLAQGLSETPLYLPDCRFCYSPPDYAPLPARSERADGVVFGCFNNYAKLDTPVFTLWAELLRRQPGARLLLKSREYDDPTVAEHCHRRWLAAGGDPHRLALRGYSLHADALAQYADIDIALDPFPFTGGITTLEALWMGVPVVSLAGDRIASRQGAALLGTAGLTEWVADDTDTYLAIAESLAADTAGRRHWRQTLRPRLAASPLCQAARFSAALEATLLDGWRRLGFTAPGAFADV